MKEAENEILVETQMVEGRRFGAYRSAHVDVRGFFAGCAPMEKPNSQTGEQTPDETNPGGEDDTPGTNPGGNENPEPDEPQDIAVTAV